MSQIRYILVVFLSLLALVGCADQCLKDQLAVAESVMEEYPDSAYSIISQLDYADISSERDQHLYALINSRCADKLDMDITGDTLIGRAAEYYDINKDWYHYIMAFHCLERVKFEQGCYPSSLSMYVRAYEAAVNLSDPYWIGLCARDIADAYNKMYLHGDELHYVKIEYENFKKSGNDNFSDWALVDLARAYLNVCDMDSAINTSAKVIDMAKNNSDTTLLYEGLTAMGECYFAMDSVTQGIDYYQESMKTGLTSLRDSCKLGRLYLSAGKIAKCEAVMSQILDRDDPMVELVKYEYYASKGLYKDALSSYIRMDSISESRLRPRVTDYVYKDVQQQYDIEKRATEERIKNQRLVIIICILSILLIIMIIIFAIRAWKKKIDERRLVYECLIEDIKSKLENSHLQILHKEDIIKDCELQIKKQNLRLEIDKEQIAGFQTAALTLLSSQFKHFDVLFKILDEDINDSLKDKKLLAALHELIKNLSSTKGKRHLEELINQNTNNLMANFRADFPGLKDKDYDLLIYHIMGFRTNSIVAFLSEKNTAAIYNRKRRLMDKIEASKHENKEIYNKLFSK